MSNKELRFLSNDLKAQTDSRTISGYASKYETLSKDLGGFKEIIKRGAFKNAINSKDIIANINHDDNKILARSGNNLILKEDPIGLFFELEVPDTTYGNDLLVNVRTGNVSKCSFAFTVKNDSWEQRSGIPIRLIHEIRQLHDVAIVTIPAYEDTNVAIRSLKKIQGVDDETKQRIEKAKSYEQ